MSTIKRLSTSLMLATITGTAPGVPSSGNDAKRLKTQCSACAGEAVANIALARPSNMRIDMRLKMRGGELYKSSVAPDFTVNMQLFASGFARLRFLETRVSVIRACTHS